METNEMISEETDKRNDLSANNIIPQGQNILCAFSCADSKGFVDKLKKWFDEDEIPSADDLFKDSATDTPV